MEQEGKRKKNEYLNIMTNKNNYTKNLQRFALSRVVI